MRNAAKRICRCLSGILVSPLVVLFKLTGSIPFFAAIGQFLSLIPGNVGSYLRVAFYRMTLKTAGRDGFIGFGTYLTNPEVELGDKYYIGAYCIIGMAKIGSHATIASGVSILSGKTQHGFEKVGVPIQEQKGTFRRISIGENCWIGNGAIIMADLGIQNVVAAGSVVVCDTDDFGVWAGNPAKLIREIALGRLQNPSSTNSPGDVPELSRPSVVVAQ